MDTLLNNVEDELRKNLRREELRRVFMSMKIEREEEEWDYRYGYTDSGYPTGSMYGIVATSGKWIASLENMYTARSIVNAHNESVAHMGSK